jgi:hypothetical protein
LYNGGKRCAWRPISTVSLPGCYIATVNESETITAAQEFCPVRGQKRGLRALTSGFPAEVDALIGVQICTNIERS